MAVSLWSIRQMHSPHMSLAILSAQSGCRTYIPSLVHFFTLLAFHHCRGLRGVAMHRASVVLLAEEACNRHMQPASMPSPAPCALYA